MNVHPISAFENEHRQIVVWHEKLEDSSVCLASHLNLEVRRLNVGEHIDEVDLRADQRLVISEFASLDDAGSLLKEQSELILGLFL